MPVLELSEEQVINVVKQLTPQGKQAVFRALHVEGDALWEQTVTRGEEQMRRLCADRGMDWDNMNETEREKFVDVLLHEDN